MSNRRGVRMAKEANGWAMLDDLLVQIKLENPRASDAILYHLAQHGSKVRADGRLVRFLAGTGAK